MGNQRWVVVCETLDDDGTYLRDEYPVLFASEIEAQRVLEDLCAGCDKSFYNPVEPAGDLIVEMIRL